MEKAAASELKYKEQIVYKSQIPKVSMKHQLKLTYSEFVSMCWVCHQMSNFWAKVPSNNSTHVMNQGHKLNLKNEDEKFSVSFEESSVQKWFTKQVTEDYIKCLEIEILWSVLKTTCSHWQKIQLIHQKIY